MNRLVYLKDVTTLQVFEEKCVRCGLCLEVCPHGVLSLNGGKVQIEDRDACMECGACMQNCPAGAITVKSGVGCANAVINSLLGRQSSDSCCCVIEEKKGTSKAGKDSKACC
jgi:NAD-dependent dihydropyrimidine dehydrogenase PreA subunit